MFESVELGRKLDKESYDNEVLQIRTRLLELQQQLQQSGIPVLIIISGAEGAGKGETINKLNAWMDPRGIDTHAFWDESDEERERPFFWRFWRKLPARGTMGIFFGSWYTNLIIDRVYKKISDKEAEMLCRKINQHEQMLVLDGMLVVKFWFHLSGDEQKEAIRKIKKTGKKLSLQEKKYVKIFRKFRTVSEDIIRLTDTAVSPWNLIEAQDRRYREVATGKILLGLFEDRLRNAGIGDQQDLPSPSLPEQKTILDTVDLGQKLDEQTYVDELEKYKTLLNHLSWKARKKGKSVILLFEGWDAAGKGSSIRRVTQSLDARLYRVIQFAAPTDEEKTQHYLWRFWRQIPRAGYITIYDRSWYGRVLVERVEGFANVREWSRAYHEINSFEEQLYESATILIKFWIHIDAEEQLRRFKQREQIPWKRYKISEEDWRNREKWHEYEIAVHDMIAKTSTASNPWSLVAGNDKKFARVEILKTICHKLEMEL